jgi:hypothetical protein
MSKQDNKLQREIATLRVQLEQSKGELEEAKRAQLAEAMRFTTKELCVLGTATLLAFAGIVVESEKVVCGLLAITGVTYLWICIKHPSSIRVRLIAAVIIIVIFGAMVAFVYDRGLRKEQEDARIGLHAIVNLPPSKINTDSTFTVSNDGHYAIGRRSVFCKIVEGSAPHSHLVNSGTRTVESKISVIEPGGDADTSGCLKDLYGNIGFTLAGGDSSLSCMDIVVGVSYSLVDQPETISSKTFRFISTADNGNEWRLLRLATDVSPCHLRH